MSCGSKKGTQIYIHSFSLKKSGHANSLQVLQRCPYLEGYSLTGHFYISLDISLYLRKEHPSMFPKSGPLWKEKPLPEP
jgi:hypothetical protein